MSDAQALKAAVVLLLLSPMVPLLFMGEEWGSKQPFLFFTDYRDDLACAVREGRRSEFSHFFRFSDPAMQKKIPDPNALTSFTHSRLDQQHSAEHQDWWHYYRHLLEIRRTEIIPRLTGASSAGVIILAEGAISAAWHLGDGSLLQVYLNLSAISVDAAPSLSSGRLLFNHQVLETDYQQGVLPPYSAFVTLQEKAVTTVQASDLIALQTSASVPAPTFVLVEETADDMNIS